MRGSANEPGIIPLAVHDLFQRIQEHMDREFLVRMSYMEIYNEDINDLLVPEHRKLQIHESIEKGIFVAGLKEEIVTCAEQVMDFMSFGESHRHIGETNMNLYSSRSHTIFRMVIESREKSDDNEAEDSCDAVRVSVLNLVDLAGSERAAKTGAEGVRLKEGSHINKSLMTLGTVIKKLSEGIEGQGGHVPYRDSKLTRILQPALGGNSNTAIICNITLAQKKSDQEQFWGRAGELLIPQDPCDGNDDLRHKNTVPCVVSSLSARESEAILVIKQLQDQIKLLEAEKSSIQTNLDAVLELATQQKVSFNEEYEELQQIALAAEEQTKVANENLSTLSATVKSKQELAYEFLSNLLTETQGINVELDQWRNSVDGALSFIDELCQNLCIMAQGIREVKHSAHEDSAWSGSVIRDYEKLSTCLMDKVCKLELEKKLLEEQSQDQKTEIYKLKANLESCEKAIDDCTLQHELEKDAILLELLNLQKEVSILSSSSLMKEKESIRKELDRTKTKLRETENKLKNSIQEKIKLQSEKAEAHKEIKKLQSQRTLLERDLRKRDSATVDKRHELNSMPHELSGAFEHMQEDYQNLEMHALDMDAEISSLQEALVTSIAEKDEALSKVELMTSELEDLANKLNSTESERNSFSNEIALLTKKLNASESTLKSLETSLNSVSREKEDLGMQLTDALLDMESERSIWTAKEKEYLEANHRLNICLDENRKLSEDLIKVRQELGCCREQCKILEDKLALSMESDMNEKGMKCSGACKESSQIVEKGRTISGAVCENELHKQLLMITEERNCLLSETQQLRFLVAEAEVLKENCDRKLIHAKDTIDELSSRISVMEVNMKNDAAANNKEKTKLRMEIRWLRPQLDAHRGRLKEAMDEMKTMDAKYQQASTMLKKELSQNAREVLRLRGMLKELQSASN